MILSFHMAALAVIACPVPATAAPAETGLIAAAAVQGYPMVGGYREVDAADAGVQAAAAFAANELGAEIHEIESAHRQTVQGANYRIVFSTADGSRWQVVVYQPLRGDLQLTSSEQL